MNHKIKLLQSSLIMKTTFAFPRTLFGLLILSHITFASSTAKSQFSTSFLKTLPPNDICETVGRLIYNSTLRESFTDDLYAFPVSSSLISSSSLNKQSSPLIRCLVRTKENNAPFPRNIISLDNNNDDNNDNDDNNENTRQQEWDEYIGTGYSISETQEKHACFFPCSKLLYTFSDSSSKDLRVLVVQKPLSDDAPCALHRKGQSAKYGFFDVDHKDKEYRTCIPRQEFPPFNITVGNLLRPFSRQVSSGDERNSIVSEFPNTLDSFKNRALRRPGFKQYNICVQKLIQIVLLNKQQRKSTTKADYNSVSALPPTALNLIRRKNKHVLQCLFREKEPNVYNIIPVTEKLQSEVCVVNCLENLYNMTTVHSGSEYVQVSFAPGCVPRRLTTCRFRRGEIGISVGPTANRPRAPLAAVFQVEAPNNSRKQAIEMAFAKFRMQFSDLDKVRNRYKVTKVVRRGNKKFRVFLNYDKITSEEF